MPTVEIFLSHLLVSATRLQEVAMVLTILAHGVDVNTPAGYWPKTTALYDATVREDLNLVRILLNAGANPNAICALGEKLSPLQASVLSLWGSLGPKSNHQLVQMLLDAGGDVNVPPVNSRRQSPLLTTAIFQRDADLVRILLKAKAKVNVMTKSSVTALQTAASVNNLEILQILVDAGADVNAPFGKRCRCCRMATATSNNHERDISSISHRHLISAIQHAADNGNIEMVQVLLDADADADGILVDENQVFDTLDEENDDDFYFDTDQLQTPLQLAVLNENSILVRLLLSAGADANAQQFGDTPLQLAAGKANISMARFLLRKGANVNAAARENGGRTALQAAATIGNNDLVQILLDEGADVNAPPAFGDGRTAIQAAAEGRHTEILKTLKEHGADLNAKAGAVRGRTCLQAAAENGDSEMIHALMKLGAEVNSPAADERGRTALQAAIQSHDSASIDLLLRWGADINAAPSPVKGVSALYGAVSHEDLTLVRRLLKVANPNGATSQHPPIVEAARLGSFDIVQSLIEAGADVNALGDEQETSQYALQAAMKGSNIEVLRLLLKTHANINASTANLTSTPLELAVEKSRRDMVHLLLANGAIVDPTPNVENPDSTALSQAVSNCREDSVLMLIIEDLITAGADVNRGSKKFGLPLTAAVKYFPLAKRLLDAGANVNGQWPGRPTALQEACERRDIDTVKLLIDSGADINAPAVADRGRTALQAAVERGSIAIIKLLLQRGADCNGLAAESKGGTALQLAAIGGRISVVLLLLRAEAEINAAPSMIGGRTALEGAAEHGRLDVVSLLLENDTGKDGIEARCQRAAKLASANGHLVIARILKEYKKN